MRLSLVALALLVASCATPQQPPTGTDADTVAWWGITGYLSSDAMEGRDTGSPGYDRAARYVAERFAKAGLTPAGEGGTWFQTLPLQQVQVDRVTLGLEAGFHNKHADGSTAIGSLRSELRFLHDFTVRPTSSLPAKITAYLAFRGYCSPGEMGDVRGKIVICFGTRRAGMTTAAQRLEAAASAGAVGVINVDDPGFTIEPSRWPEAYARSVTFHGSPPPAFPDVVAMRMASQWLSSLTYGTGEDAESILARGKASKPLPSFDINSLVALEFAVSQRQLQSDNVLAILPGIDPVLKDEFVIVSAHLDGYGYGEPVNGDSLYNGAFDNAAYIATLVRLAEERAGKGFKRSVLFAAYTGEEKGLLGSTWFASHLTIPKDKIAAVVNLDQLRPIFPLKILTMHAIEDTTLANNVRRVADGMGIEIRPDLEPERNLNQRTDHWPFLRIGVPATSFVFGFDPGTEAEGKYREWYQTRYHRPQDDMNQPLDWGAARDMNTFFNRLVEDIANDPIRPSFVAGSPLAPN